MGKDRRTQLKANMHEKNINNRGNVPSSRRKKEDKFPVGPVLLGFFLFLVVGSALF
jgi:hypothetical protein